MIAVRLQGQLGNQLFQIGFIRYAAELLGESYVIIDDRSYGCLPDRYFRLRFFERRIPRKILQRYFSFTGKEIKEYSNWLSPSAVLADLKPGVIYQGFFQSSLFLGKSAGKDIFRLKNEYIEGFRQKYGSTFSRHRVIAVHIRLKDYFEIGDERLGGKGLQLPLEYYEGLLKRIAVGSDTKVMVISDDVEYVKAKLRLDIPFTIEANHFITDLLILMHADVLVLSNSTFSWWGAFLNVKKDCTVYAPEHWMGFKVGLTYPVDIMNSNWITEPVYPEKQ